MSRQTDRPRQRHLKSPDPPSSPPPPPPVEKPRYEKPGAARPRASPENEERWQRAQFYYEIQPVPTQASAPTHFVFLRAATAAANSGKAGKGVRDLRVRVLLENEVTQQAKAAPWR